MFYMGARSGFVNWESGLLGLLVLQCSRHEERQALKRFYQFIQPPIFSKLLDGTGEDGLLEAIEEEVLRNPKGRDSIKGGIRKTRVAPSTRKGGKSYGYRVWFFHDVPNDMYLLFLLDKREAGNSTPKQEKELDLELKKALGKDKK